MGLCGESVSLGTVIDSKLNPRAKEWNPFSDVSPVEDRCLFLTFSNGYPLSEYEIVEFFTRCYGMCVATVYVHWPKVEDKSPVFGKIVFSTSAVPAAVLNGANQRKFTVGGKHMWCKKYECYIRSVR